MSNKVRATSREFVSIYNELMEAVPNVTKMWDSNTEADAGIVLVKLMAMSADMLSYNLDKTVQEVYPETVTQRNNAAQVFGLMGYKMRWYRSAQCIAKIVNNGSKLITVPRYSKFITRDEGIYYTNLSQIEISAGFESEVKLYQGVPRTPPKLENKVIALGNETWHSIYNYNVTSKSIIDNRIYINDKEIDESSIMLIDNLGDTWKQSENISAETDSGKYYELKIDNNDNPYIRLVSYWNTFKDIDKFKLFYVVSNGGDGQIGANTIQRIESNVISENVETSSADLSITNLASTLGYNPETPDEARDEAPKYVNTFNTLITLDDFRKAILRLNGVANCLVTDLTTDPYIEPTSQYTPLSKFEMKAYIARHSDYQDMEKLIYKNYILNEINSNRHYPLTIRIVIDEQESGDYEPATNYYDWTVNGKVYLSEPVSMDRAKEVLVNIDTGLKKAFSADNIEFNSILKYTDIVNAIMKSDGIISYVDIDNVEYHDDINDENSVPLANPRETITGKYTKNVLAKRNGLPDYQALTPEIDGALYWLDQNERYVLNMPNTPIKPGSVCIRLENSEYVIIDDKNGNLICNHSILNHGIVDYKNGKVDMYLNGDLTGNFTLSYSKNKVCLVRFAGVNTNKLTVDTDSLKQ